MNHPPRQASFESCRPAPELRAFTSPAVEEQIGEVVSGIGDPQLAWLFANCFPNTLDTTVRYREVDGRPDTFVITGDIAAMWLRDSTCQVWPYLPLAKRDRRLQSLLAGVVNRQAACILIDPYANAFNDGPAASSHADDLTTMTPDLHERKWEVDSLCHAVRLSYGYWKATGDGSCFDGRWRQAMHSVIATFRRQQAFQLDGPYTFRRASTIPHETLPLGGCGGPTRRCGLIRSGFRPSDDACTFPFLVPSNVLAAVSLEQLAQIAEAALSDAALASQARDLAAEIRAALAEVAVVPHPSAGPLYAYEVDGYGSGLFMDDANVPSLLSLPYLGCCPSTDAIYRNTRQFVLSPANPWYFAGRAGSGVGSPHTGWGRVWPISIAMRGLTSDDPAEVKDCLRLLRDTHAGTGFMHESFDADDPAHFSRTWFAWANSLFGELVLHAWRRFGPL